MCENADVRLRGSGLLWSVSGLSPSKNCGGCPNEPKRNSYVLSLHAVPPLTGPGDLCVVQDTFDRGISSSLLVRIFSGGHV